MNLQGRVLILLALLLPIKATLHAQLPQAYDLRTQSLVTPVKDQGSCGACWAFATLGAIESNWLKQGLSQTILSEDNLIDCHQFDEGPCVGGSFYMSQALLSRYGGPILAADDGYTPTVANCTNNLPLPPLPPALVEEIRFLPGDIQVVKQALYDHGALATAMFFNPANYNPGTYKYYDAALDGTDSLYPHCVTLAGWNDNLAFPGAPGAGGWIIKDSYGTSWADNGYFYVSYHDAGILSETVYFPSREPMPASPVKPHVYYHDTYGWVDNFGFSNKLGYGLVKYTLSPSSGAVVNQQIRRIGTYAVEDGTQIEVEVYRTFNAGVLSDLVGTGSVYCPRKGFYIIPLETGTELLGQAFYVKVRYEGPAPAQAPIPIEVYEAQHTSGIVLSSNSCYVSTNGSNWVATGQGTPYSFDLCIKMYTVDAPLAQIQTTADALCEGEPADFFDVTPQPRDSVQWFVNGLYQGSQPTLNIHFTQAGGQDVALVAHLGEVTDTIHQAIQVNPLPPVPTITESGDTLYCSTAAAYQWHDSNGPLPGETQAYFVPQQSGQYLVEVSNAFQCTALSDPYDFTLSTSVESLAGGLRVFPNPFRDEIRVSWGQDRSIDQVIVYDLFGKVLARAKGDQQGELRIALPGLPRGVYFLEILSGEQVYRKKILSQ